MEEQKSSNSHVQYYCIICNTKPDQISHHKAHLKTQKHIFKKKCFEQCINMTIFHIHNTKNISKQEIIKMFEDDTNYKYIQEEIESIEKFRNWRITREELLKSEYPNAIIPNPNIDSENSLFIDNWLKLIMDTNETAIIKSKKPDSYMEQNIKLENYNLFKENIYNKSVEELIIKAIEIQSEFDVAVVFYKLLSNKYAFKSFKGNVWIDKTNILLSCDKVLINIRTEITSTLKDVFENFSKNLNPESEQYKSCLKIIEQLKKTSFKNNIIRESKELFFDN
jgi:hypothetical protein